MFYVVIKLDGSLKIQEKVSNVQGDLSQYKTWLSLPYDIDLYREKLQKAS
jgi:hypothetical protein